MINNPNSNETLEHLTLEKLIQAMNLSRLRTLVAIQDAGEMLALGTPREVREQAGDAGADMNSAFIAIVEQGRAARENKEKAA